MHDLLFKNISRFIDLTDDEKQYFSSLLKVKKLRKKQYLLQEGDICRYECFVNKGCLRAYSVDEKGQEHIVQFAIEDWWIGDMYSFLTQTPARLTIDALEDAELFCIDNPSLENIFSRIPKFERFFRMLVQNAFIAGQRRIIDSMSLTADELYCRFIENYPLMEQRLPLKQIASFLGITPESLSRIRSQYKKNKSA